MFKLWFAVEEIDKTEDHYQQLDFPIPVGPFDRRDDAFELLDTLSRKADDTLPGDLARFTDCDYEVPFQGYKVHLAVEEIEGEQGEETYDTLTERTVAVLGECFERRAFDLANFLAGYGQRMADAASSDQ